MIRLVLVAASLTVSIWAIFTDSFLPDPNSKLCLLGACRFDQIDKGLDTSKTGPASSALLLTDPANPAVWATYAEILSARGENEKAADAFDHALASGPNIAPTWMRAANFYFTHNRQTQGFSAAARILSLTGAFDEILFSYLSNSGAPVSQLLGHAIPADSRAAHAWLGWLAARGSIDDLEESWSWTTRQNLGDQQTATAVVQALWRKQAYSEAQSTWIAWQLSSGERSRAGENSELQLLRNQHFETDPLPSPFDWTIEKSPDFEMVRQDGLEIRFPAAGNIDFHHVHQSAVLKPGKYRFSAEVETDHITTNEGPFFRISDVANESRFAVETEKLTGSRARSWINVDFTVPAGTPAVAIRLLRRPTNKFDNKLGGRLHIYQVALRQTTASVQ
jgi:hypothetical protein